MMDVAVAHRRARRSGLRPWLWLWLACACGTAAPPASQCQDRSDAGADACRVAADARRADTADLCLQRFLRTLDPATGARAARALQSRDDKRAIVEWIAGMIGDAPAGADAWLALGVSRRAAGDFPGSLAAFERAQAHRAPSDTLGRLHDAVGRIYYHEYQAEYQAAFRAAVDAYELVGRVCGPDDRATAYLNIASLLSDVGNVAMTAEVLDQARAAMPVTSRNYGYLRKLDAVVEDARGNPARAQRAQLEARAFAIRDGNAGLEFDVRMNLIAAALGAGELDDAAALLAFEPLATDALPNDRAVDAYHRGQLALARGNPAAAAHEIERVLPAAPESWIGPLEDVHGRALARAGDAPGAERALVRAVEAVERQRDNLDGDTLKSWLLALQREPFEDLFLLDVAQGRLEDALEVVQRATARSTLDGLLQAEPRATSIAAAGARSETMRKLARALRSSRASVVPPIATVLTRLRGNHLVTYFRARRELWAIAVAGDGVLHAHRIGDVAAIASQVTAWRRNSEDTGIAERLGTTLLPDEIMPVPGAPLYIAADEPIAEVSFAALRRRGELVLDRHAVAYAPSAAVLSAMRRSQARLRALVLGDPTGDLPEARAEATEVAARLHAAPRLGGDATRAAVLDAGEATLIHIAAHTEPTAVGAALRLADGLLDAGAVIDHGVAAGAIVLLTCSAAAITSRDELAPLAAAFVAAGAHSVVASRWAVTDAVGRQFARMFYDDNGLADPVRAVADAQRTLAAQRDPHIPVEQWSTFAVIGGLP
jgi:tetratricopeptide (TPR) repeat protein